LQNYKKSLICLTPTVKYFKDRRFVTLDGSTGIEPVVSPNLALWSVSPLKPAAENYFII